MKIFPLQNKPLTNANLYQVIDLGHVMAPHFVQVF